MLFSMNRPSKDPLTQPEDIHHYGCHIFCPILSRNIKNPVGRSAACGSEIECFSHSQMREMPFVLLIVNCFAFEFFQEDILRYTAVGDRGIFGKRQSLKLSADAFEECRT